MGGTRCAPWGWLTPALGSQGSAVGACAATEPVVEELWQQAGQAEPRSCYSPEGTGAETVRVSRDPLAPTLR